MIRRFLRWLGLSFCALLCLILGFALYRYLTLRAHTYEIPFDRGYSGKGAIIVDLTLNGRGPYPFLLDTCADRNLVDKSVLKEIGATFTGNFEISSGGKATTKGRFTTLKRIGIGQASLTNVGCVEATFGGSRQFVGILGLDLFSEYAVKVDFDRRTVSVTPKIDYFYLGSGEDIRVNGDRPGGLPTLIAKVDGAEAKLRIDTGNQVGLILHAAFTRDRRIGQTHKKIPGSENNLVTGWVPGDLTRLDSFEIGSYSIKGEVATLWKSMSDDDGFSSGNIGVPELQRFNVTFDFPHGLIYLEPNQYFADPVRAPRSGIIWNRHIHGWVILSVQPQSPAAEAGLTKDDRILEIDGSEISKMDGEGVEGQLSRPAGTILHLKIDRQGVIHDIRLKLRDLL